MADLRPEDIQDPDVPPSTSEPANEPDEDEAEAEAEEPEKKPDLAAAAKHLVVAVAELARTSGSPPAVAAALDQARIALGK
jgi:hypothetical protein